ncbi:MAG TPA: ATP-binding protein, partial [Terriglobales bacterium]|nr:ATP-binding protein [Terriglobales bacterium]
SAQTRGVRLGGLIADDRPHVTADADRLQQVMWNLLTNAIKFTPAGGDVEVRLGAAGEEAVVIVRDTGSGIAPGVLPHIFERFRQADSSSTRAHRGLGIGLALVKYLVDLHGGTVSAESAGVGLGATFVVRLPRRLSTAVPPLEAPTRAERPGAWRDVPAIRGARLLAVDDEPDSLEVLATMLAEAGAEVRAAGSVPEALALLEAWRPDAVLSDLEMPGADGFALVRSLRAHADARVAQIPAIAVTAYGRVEDRGRALASGFSDHVVKPFDPPALIAAIVAVLQQRASPGAQAAPSSRAP